MKAGGPPRDPSKEVFGAGLLDRGAGGLAEDQGREEPPSDAERPPEAERERPREVRVAELEPRPAEAETAERERARSRQVRVAELEPRPSEPAAAEEAEAETEEEGDAEEAETVERAAADEDNGSDAARRRGVRRFPRIRPSGRRRPGAGRYSKGGEGELPADQAEEAEGRRELSFVGAEEAGDEEKAVLVEEPGPIESAGGAGGGVAPEVEEVREPRRRRRRRRRGEAGPRERGRGPRADRADKRSAEIAEEAAKPKKRGLRRILINATDEEEIRIALLQDRQLEELYYERPAEKKYLGNIYKGRIVNLEPAIQAAFVDLGIGRNGFLHVSDVLPVYQDAAAIPIENLSRRIADWKKLRIQDILHKGQEVLVQISKDSIGAKGPSLTTYVSVPGKYLVLMPGVNRHGVSKRIHDTAERAELRDKLANLNPPPGIGYIVRTAGQDKPQEVLAKDFEYLMKVWGEISRGVEEEPVPSLLYAESDLVIRTMRDFFGADVDEMLIDEPSVYERARRFLEDVMPQAAKRVRRYTGNVPLFVRFGVEEAIERIYNRRVPLPSGGHLVIEQTEALVAIDVNSGKYRDEEDLESTALKTNLEAAEELGRQLRLRDLGGVIIIDFIDMEIIPNRREVERALREALREDRAKSWFTQISRFGIVEMTRQRVRPSFERANYEPCKLCGGTGVVKSPRNTGMAILRQLRENLATKRRKTCEVLVYPDVASYLNNERRRHLLELESQFEKTIVVRAEPEFSPDQYVVRFV